MQVEITSTTAVLAPALPGVWKNRDFKMILFGQGISNLGDAVSATTLPLLVLALTGSGEQMGIVGMLQMLPHIVWGLPAGALADRWDRRRTMLACDLLRALLTALIPLALLLQMPVMPVIYALAIPLSCLGILFGAAYSAAVPSLVGHEQIGQASSYFEALESISWIAGPILAGLLVAVIGPGPTLVVDALSFLVSALSLRFVHRRLGLQKSQVRSRLLHEIWEGIVYISRRPLLRVLLGYRSVLRVFLAAIIPALTFHIVVDRQMPASLVGLCIAVYASGSLLGTLLGGRLAQGWIGRIIPGCGLIMGGACVLLGHTTSLVSLLPAAFAFGVAEGLELVLYLTARATATEDELLGRVSNTFTTVILGSGSLGMLFAGFLLDRAGGTATLTVMGVLTILAVIAFACLPALRRAEPGRS